MCVCVRLLGGEALPRVLPSELPSLHLPHMLALILNFLAAHSPFVPQCNVLRAFPPSPFSLLLLITALTYLPPLPPQPTPQVLPLTLRVLTGTAHPLHAPLQRNHGRAERSLRIEITENDDDDEGGEGGGKDSAAAYFLYTLDVSESDYPALKRDQSLLVDFAAFPNQFIDLVEGCRPPPSSSSPSSLPPSSSSTAVDLPPKYLARLTIPTSSPSSSSSSSSPGIFGIVEATQFKELTHLSLAFRPPTDHTLKAYLATRLRHLTPLHTNATHAHLSSSSLLSQEQARTHFLSLQLTSLQHQKEEELSSLRSSHSTTLQSALTTYTQEKQALLNKHEQQLTSLKKRLEETERRRAELAEARHGQEASLRELTREVDGLTTRLVGKEEEVLLLQGEKKEVEGCLRKVERERDEVMVKLEGLRQQLCDQGEVLGKTKALQVAAEGGRKRMEEALELYKNNALTLQEKLEVSVGEIQKGNAIIHKLQGEVQGLRGKIKTKNEVLKKQEALLMEGQRGQDAGQNRLSAAVQENGGLTQVVGEMKVALQEARRENESNQQVITWLNKEINDLQLGRGSSGLMYGTTGGGMGCGGKALQNHHRHSTSSSTAASVATFIPSYHHHHHTTPAKGTSGQPLVTPSPVAAAAAATSTTKKQQQQQQEQQQPQHERANMSASSLESASSTHYLDALGLSDPYQQ